MAILKEHFKIICIGILLLALMFGIIFGLSKKDSDTSIYSLDAQSKMSSQDYSQFFKRKLNLEQHRGTPIIREVVSVPKESTVIREVERVVKGKDSEYISEPTKQKITEPSDKTVVIEDKKEVSVYKINNNKSHQIKAGMSIIGEKPYVNLAYQAGNFEIIAHSDLKDKVSGVTAMYTIKKW